MAEPAPPPAHPARAGAGLPRPGLLILLHAAVILAVALLLHPTPLYFVETDLVGEYIPAARDLLAGRLNPERYAFKGPGYPALLAAASIPCGGDLWLAARVLGAAASAAAAWLAFRLVSGWVGPAVAGFALLGMLLNPTFVRYGIEAGTDLPAMTLMLAATVLLLQAPGGRGALAAGLAAGLAIVTRWNAAFLVPAGLVVLLARPGRARSLAAFAAGLAATVGLWLVVESRLGAAANRNYLNIAFELYGRDLPWDRFEAEIGSRFRSFGDVLAFDPAGAAGRIAWNLGAHFVNDLGDLVPWWIGVLAGPGLLLAVRRREWRLPLLFVALCSLALAPVFYSARFTLYLLPFHLAAAGVLLFEAPRLAEVWGVRPPGPAAAPVPRPSAAGPGGAFAPVSQRPARVAAALVLAASGVLAASQATWNLMQAPHEARVAGEFLRREGFADGRIMARKPHVAYFAGMEHVAMGPTPSLAALLAGARAAGAGYLFFSPIEQLMRGEYAVLGDSGLALPGLEQIAYRAMPRRRYYAVYRVDPAAPDTAALAREFVRAVIRHADLHREDPAAQVFAGFQLVRAGQSRAAVERLRPLVESGVEDANVETMLSTAYFQLGEWDSSYAACLRAMRLQPALGWHHARLGSIHEVRGRHREARDEYRRALEREPGNVLWLERLGLMHMALGEAAEAAPVFERCVKLDPRNARLRRFAIGAWQRAGDAARARALLDEGVRAGIPVRELLEGPAGE
jgi:4-amino-4-deoxy-L-arabinose transferase-like glycosyltransferase/Flp pilus assembly protein TadD